MDSDHRRPARLTTDMARDLTASYVSALMVLTVQLQAVLPWVGRVGVPGMLVGRTADGDYLRTGSLPEGGEFSFHGIGCRIEDLDGAVVDFDWDSNGRQVFDPWRIRKFGQSVGSEVKNESLLLIECRQLVTVGALQEFETGWFGLSSQTVLEQPLEVR